MPTVYKPRKTTMKKTKSEAEKQRKLIYRTERWKKLRALKLAETPLCELCQQEGRVTPAIDVHHAVSFMQASGPAERYQLAFDYNNLMSLCKQCHQKIHNHVGQDEACK